MVLKKEHLLSMVLSFIIFLILNIPSLKIIYSTPLINIILPLALWSVGILKIISNKQLNLSYSRVKFLLILYMFWGMIFLITFVRMPTLLTYDNLLKYIVSLIIVTGVLLFLYKQEILNVLYFQVLWALCLSMQKIIWGIELNRGLGQHYLTLGLPLSAGIVCAILLLFYERGRKITKTFLIVSITTILFALTSLSGRSPVILSVLIPLIITIIHLFMEKRIVKKVKVLIAILMFIPVFLFLVYNNMSDRLLNTLTNDYNFENEPRFIIYSKSISLIKDNPLGYGLNSGELGVSYPHNIFLETAMSGGIFSLSILVIMLFFVFSKFFKAINYGSYKIVCSALALLYFLTWNISYDLTSSYIPFSAIAILIISTEKNNYNST
ncbi:O-antigen ligase family protein [Virgibacillus chiguensis]|uniref:O-Antigen ligase n=1 Tax=Virgibacillus chiguensis TaxID=411959 RepID=A0A1M5QK59_9BACI|nr:O-antigen ligase family protein [Virgibacillus chiguensis]SHH14485.1 O-Antigen ligase [Virgibacillus chiguensis]